MCRNVQKYTEMYKNVQKCAKIYKDVQFNIIRRKINELHKCIQTLLIIIINISHTYSLEIVSWKLNRILIIAEKN